MNISVRQDITVVIPTLGRPILERTLAALLAGTVLPGRVLVVHQGDDPVVVEQVEAMARRGLRVERVSCAVRGAAAGRNRGIQQTATPWLAALDDDCLPHSGWLETLLARLERHPEALVTGWVEAPEEGEAPSTITEEESAIYVRPVFRFDPLYTGNMGCALTIARRIGPFDESPTLCAAEDNDWSYRALRLGVPVVYAPEVAVTHADWRSDAQLDAVYRSYALGQGAFYGKYLRRGDHFIALRALRDLLRCPVRWLRGRWRGDPEMARSGRAYTLGLLPGIWAGFKERRF